MKIYLASNSPRRKQIMKEAGYTFEIIKSDFDEAGEYVSPVKMATAFSYGKALDVFNKLKDKENAVVIGADTTVYFENEIIGKPKDEKDAFNTLKRLSDNTHTVVTGFTIITKDKVITDYDTSTVTFNNLTDDLISEYVKSGKPMDKAGSYGIQDGFPIVKEYTGSFTNIIGLPIEKVKKEIDKLLK